MFNNLFQILFQEEIRRFNEEVLRNNNTEQQIFDESVRETQRINQQTFDMINNFEMNNMF